MVDITLHVGLHILKNLPLLVFGDISYVMSLHLTYEYLFSCTCTLN